MKKDILEKTAKEYFDSGNDEFEKKRYNAALVLFFKALISLIDIYILEKSGKTPSSHNERFSITKQLYPEIYNLLDKDFPYYQGSYFQLVSRELAEVIRDDACALAKKTGITL